MRELLDRTLRKELRASTAAQATGRVLEIGVGSGLNLPLYVNAGEVVGIDPGPKQLRRARRTAASASCPVTLLEADAESLPFSDSGFDTLVLSYVLCTVPDPDMVLAEAARVLTREGRLVFLEHVRSRSSPGALILDAVTPVYARLDGGCHPNRRSLAAIRRHFVVERLWEQGFLVKGSARPGATKSV
jgi:ubiquinone/menaquinone biosynthesis C-methylase UbiE